MKAYVAVLSAQMRILLQYRAAALANIGTQLVFGFIHIMVFEAFYKSSPGAHPMTYREVVNYVWLSQAMIALQPWGVNLEIREFVRSGTLAYELLRPVNLYNFWFSRGIAQRIAPTLLRAVPLFAITGLFFGLEPPPSWQAGLCWIVATLGAVLLSCAFANLGAISLLWTLSGEGMARLMPGIIIILSGMLVPLPLYPDWAQTALNILPFRGLVDVPFRLYIGHIPPGELPTLFLHQLVWTAILTAFGRWLLARSMRRLVIQGG